MVRFYEKGETKSLDCLLNGNIFSFLVDLVLCYHLIWCILLKAPKWPYSNLCFLHG